jgi:hypothetical protein
MEKQGDTTVSMTKQEKRDEMFKLVEAGYLIGALSHLDTQLDESPLLTDGEKAPYTAAITGLADLLGDRMIVAREAILKKKGD